MQLDSAAAAAGEAAVRVENVSYDYGHGKALDGISFTVGAGDLLGIIGPNGSGKTTLFRCMLGLIEDYQGSIEIFGQDVRKNRKAILQQIGYVPQKASFEQSFPATVEEIVLLGAVSKKRLSRQQVHAALETVDLLDKKDRRIGELSGGQQQRVFIAKALVNDPRLLILDEPATGIDVEAQERFYSLVRKLNREKGITMIWSSHDLEAISSLANKVACINRSMFFHGQAHEFFEDESLLKKYSESSMQAHMHEQHHDHHQQQHQHSRGG